MSHDPRALAKSAGVIEAMRIATAAQRAASRDAAAGWLQRDDGSWSAVGNDGRERPMATRPTADDELAADLTAALAAVADPVILDVEPLYSPGLRHVLEIAERIARDRGAQTVEIDDLELALAGRGRGGESPGRHPQ